MSLPALSADFSGNAYVVAGMPSGGSFGLQNVVFFIQRAVDHYTIDVSLVDGFVAILGPTGVVASNVGADAAYSVFDAFIAPYANAITSLWGLDLIEPTMGQQPPADPEYKLMP